MSQNPFYVHPGTDFGPGLMGLAQTVGEVGERKDVERKEQEEKDRIAAIKSGAVEAFKSGDPDKIREYMIANPEMSKSVKDAIELKLPGDAANKYTSALFRAATDSSQAPGALEAMRDKFAADGLDAAEIEKLNSFGDMIKNDPDQAQKVITSEFALLATDEEWKRYKDIAKPTGTGQTEKIKNFEYHQKLLKDDPMGAAKFADLTNSEYSPSPLKKLIGERQVLIDDGTPLDDPIIRAYDAKITGVDVDIKEMTQDEIDTWGAYLNYTGKMPALGRGKAVTKIRARIVKSAAAQALGSKVFGGEDAEPDKTPAQAALGVLGSQSDTKAIQGSLNLLDKQLSSMGSFVDNIGMQIEKVSGLSKDLKTFDARILNVPLRLIRGKITGSPLQAKYDMYLTEIESEIGKLATGSASSIAELSIGAQEKWAKIHDKNLSVKDMLSLLEETRDAAKMRHKSVETQLQLSRARMRNRGILPTPESSASVNKMTDEDLQKIIRGE